METDRRGLVALTAASAVSAALGARPASRSSSGISTAPGDGKGAGAIGDGADAIEHKPPLARSAAITRSMRTLLDDEPSLRHFFTYATSADPSDATDAVGQANADNWAEVTRALRSFDYRELRLKMPAGIVPMAKMDFAPLGADEVARPVSRVTLDVLGTVQLVGTDGRKHCIFGSSQYEEHPPASGDPPYIRGVTVQGGSLLVAPREGERYRHGMQLDAFVEGIFQRVYVSGEFAPSSDGHRKAVKSDVAFLNRFQHCGIDSPGPAPNGKKSYNLWQGFNNNNNNVFSQCRLSGARGVIAIEPAPRRVAMHLTGENNLVEGCDLSVFDTLVEVEAARSLVMLNCYGELAGTVLDATRGLSLGLKILGGYFEIAARRTAIKAGSTQGLEIAGGHWAKVTGASATTFMDLGSACYGRTIRDIETLPERSFDIWETGIEHGHGGVGGRAESIKTARLMFPAAPVPSADPNTLDAYQEGTWTPLWAGATLLGPGGRGAPVATYTKIGNHVILRLWLSVGAETSTSMRGITGIPFEIAETLEHGVSIGYQKNPRRYGFRIGRSSAGTSLYPFDPADGTDRAPSHLSNTEFSLVITYRAKA